MPRFRHLLLLTLLVFAGCASMNESECRVADWNRVGLSDGGSGVPEGRLASYAKDCGEIGIEPDARAYRQGWDQGIAQYCTPANGWRAGVNGQSGKAAACQGQPNYEGFSRYLQAGLQLHETQSRMNRNDSEVRRLQKKLEEAKSDDDKKRIREQLRSLDRDQFHLRNTLQFQRLSAP
jgi:hypothetical protein